MTKTLKPGLELPDMKRHVTPREAAMAYENTKKFSQPQPDDVMRDSRYKVPVSRQGLDKGAITRDSYIDLVEDPHNPLKLIEAQRLNSGIGRMLKAKQITPAMARAGLYFQRHFDIAGFGHYSSVRLDDNLGGGDGVEGHFQRTMDSRNIVAHMLKAMSYPYTQISKAAFWIIGHRMGLEEMTKRIDLHDFEGGRDLRYWRAHVVSALEIMDVTYTQDREKNKKPQEIRSYKTYSADDLTVREGFIPIK